MEIVIQENHNEAVRVADQEADHPAAALDGRLAIVMVEMAEDHLAATEAAEDHSAATEAADQAAQEKCTRQFAQSAKRNAKFLSSLQASDQCIVETASKSSKTSF